MSKANPYAFNCTFSPEAYEHIGVIMKARGFLTPPECLRYIVSQSMISTIKDDNGHVNTPVCKVDGPTTKNGQQAEHTQVVKNTPVAETAKAAPSVAESPQTAPASKCKFETYNDYLAECGYYSYKPKHGRISQADWQYCHEQGVDGPDGSDTSRDLWPGCDDPKKGRPETHPARLLLEKRDGKPWQPEAE